MVYTQWEERHLYMLLLAGSTWAPGTAILYACTQLTSMSHSLVRTNPQVAPICVYTSGKGSSAAGLTAAVVQDANRCGAARLRLETLADPGLHKQTRCLKHGPAR